MNGILYDILHILFKRKAVIGVALLVVIAPVALMAFLRPLVFRAYVRLSVTQARAYPQISSRDEPRNLPLVDLTLINAAVNNIKSDDFIQSSAESIVKAGFPAGESGQSAKDWWAQKLTTGLEVTPIPSTPLIDVAYRAYPAQLAADLVNTIAKRYLHYQAQAMADNSTLYTFYDEQRVKNSVEQLDLARGLLEAESEAARKTPNSERLETNLVYQQIMEAGLREQATAEGLRAAREELQHNVELATDRLQELNRLGYKYDRLKSVRDAKKARYDLSLSQLEQARTAGALDVAGLTNVQAVNWASAPDLAVPRGRVLMLLLGIVGAFVVGGASAFGMETVYPTIHARRDGEMRLDLPVL